MRPPPTEPELRSALARCAPELAHAPIEPLGDGWDFWVFALGEVVLRCPKTLRYADKLNLELELLPELAPTLPAPIPVPLAVCADGPGGLPMAVYARVPGVPLRELSRRPGPEFGAAMGRFLRALHHFPVQRARELGLEYFDGERARLVRLERLDQFQADVFPLLSDETRAYVEPIVEAHISDPAQYVFEPRFCHADIDDRNVLADPATGEFTGVIDFGDAQIHSPVGDFSWAFCGGFARLGIEDQLPDLLRAGGLPEDSLYAAQLRARRPFLPIWFALHDIAHGLEIDDPHFVQIGIAELDALAGCAELVAVEGAS